jgi:hypothetical protein
MFRRFGVNVISCKGICIRHKAQKPVGTARYSTGQKRCQICELFLKWKKGSIDGRIVEFDISTKNYKSVTALERTDKYYFIIMTPKNSSILDSAIAKLESSKT